MTTESTPTGTNRHVGTLLAVLVTLSALALVVGVGAAAPNGTSVDEKAPYYANNSSAVDNTSWMEGHREPSLANVVHYSTRFSAFIVGTGTQADGVGWTGPVITGMVVYGMVISLMYRAGIGPVGGSVTMMTASFGLTTAGLAPMWVFAVGLFGVGGILAWVVRRALR